ncbi:cytochrome P450 [Nonomuraea sp. NPDC048826]|uniref:cytochrome P450 n=1 Tax=Nonomuraea sp. NPDC048826 TaxID=3364347 RepID=UPI00372102DC
MSVYARVRDYPFEMRDIGVSPLYAQLRRVEPMSRVQMPFGEPAWLATRYADVKLILTDPRFSRAIAQGLDQPRLRRQLIDDGIMGMDPPDHTRLRRLVSKAFTARRLEKMRESVRALATQLAGAMVEQGPPADVVEDFARLLPTNVICELLGVPFEDRHIFRKWTEGVTNDETAKADVIFDLGAELDDYVAGLIVQRREEPTDDLLGALVYARDNGNKLDDAELVMLAGSALLTGGVETVAAALPSFVYTLLTRPHLLEQLRAKPELLESAVEELLRYVPINTSAMFARYSLEDVWFGDTLVRTGDPVLAALHAANRDPEIFEDPETIDFTRAHNPHLTFGHGAHHCIGAQLARLELQESLRALLQHMPDLRLADGPEGVTWKYGVIVRGPTLLRVTW